MGTTLFAVFLAVSAAGAEGDVPAQVTFGFDSVEVPRGDFAISNYMTDVYGSAVSTDGARTVNGSGGLTDVFIATSLQLFQRGDFIIDFEETPITGAQFEGHVLDATQAEDFSFRAFAGDTQVFLFTRNTGEETFDSGWLEFPEPVDRVIISDSGRRDVGIDDFTVQPAPDPATGMLLLAGLAFVSARRRGRV